VVSAIAHLEGFLAEITDYSRPFTLNCQPCHLYTLLRDMVDFCQPLAQQHQCALVLAPCPTKAKPWHVHIDISRIQQALLNLIKNALEASENKQNACVTVRLGCGSKPNDPLGIEVIDQGCGLGVGQAGKLFTPFFTTKAQGTGLGLARTQKIMQAHGGSVQAVDHTAQQAHGRADNAGDNAAPTGCTFTLALPKTCLVQNPTGLMS
jgi:signal transduction histidine kinase